MIYEFDGFRPGHSRVARSYIRTRPSSVTWSSGATCTSVRARRFAGDWGGIEIEDGCNVQENCIIHMFPGVTVVLEASAHIGHGAIVHGARIGRNALIGMNAVIMDNAIVGAECIVGALTFVPADMQIPDRKVVVGNPAKIVKDVSDEMIAWKTDGTALYQALPQQLHATLKACRAAARDAGRSPAAADELSHLASDQT